MLIQKWLKWIIFQFLQSLDSLTYNTLSGYLFLEDEKDIQYKNQFYNVINCHRYLGRSKPGQMWRCTGTPKCGSRDGRVWYFPSFHSKTFRAHRGWDERKTCRQSQEEKQNTTFKNEITYEIWMARSTDKLGFREKHTTTAERTKIIKLKHHWTVYKFSKQKVVSTLYCVKYWLTFLAAIKLKSHTVVSMPCERKNPYKTSVNR